MVEGRAQKEMVGLATGGGDTSSGSRVAPPQEPPTLAEAEIDKKLSSADRVAFWPEQTVVMDQVLEAANG